MFLQVGAAVEKVEPPLRRDRAVEEAEQQVPGRWARERQTSREGFREGRLLPASAVKVEPGLSMREVMPSMAVVEAQGLSLRGLLSTGEARSMEPVAAVAAESRARGRQELFALVEREGVVIPTSPEGEERVDRPPEPPEEPDRTGVTTEQTVKIFAARAAVVEALILARVTEATEDPADSMEAEAVEPERPSQELEERAATAQGESW